MKALTALAVALLTYFAAGTVLVLLAQAISPLPIDSLGHVRSSPALVPCLVAQALDCFLTGAVVAAVLGRDVAGIVRVGAGLTALNAGLTLAFWSMMPDWYDLASVLMAPPFLGWGAAWKGAGPRDGDPMEAA